MQRLARYAIVSIRLYLGAWMLLNGINHFLPLFPQPMGGPMRSSELLVSLIETGLFGLVKTTEIIVGFMLLADLFVPVALVMALPVSVVVWYNHAILVGRPFDVSMGIGCLVWNIVLLLAYLRYFLPMMRLDTEAGTFADLRRLKEVFSPSTPSTGHGSRQRVIVAGIGLILTAGLAYHLHPHAEQPAGSGKTPMTIVNEYMNLAYAEGKPEEAAARYESVDLARKDRSRFEPQPNRPQSYAVLHSIGQGSHVAVHFRVTNDNGMNFEVVEFYEIARSQIVERIRVVGPTAGI